MSDPEASDTVKKERSAAQLEALSKARVKAAEVRAKNTELRRKEREVVGGGGGGSRNRAKPEYPYEG